MNLELEDAVNADMAAVNKYRKKTRSMSKERFYINQAA